MGAIDRNCLLELGHKAPPGWAAPPVQTTAAEMGKSKPAPLDGLPVRVCNNSAIRDKPCASPDRWREQRESNPTVLWHGPSGLKIRLSASYWSASRDLWSEESACQSRLLALLFYLT